VAEARPFKVCPAGSVCLISSNAESFAGTETVVATETSFIERVYVCADPEVLVIRIEFIMHVVDAGTVYRVAIVVDAAPRNRTLNVVGIS
jgi:hypothetical protein